VPGAINRPLYAQPSFSDHYDNIYGTVPAGILWTEASLQLTKQSSLKCFWSAFYLSNILLAEDRIQYALPDIGLRDPGNQKYVDQTFYCGVEIVR
jgi:hypothetical protein